MENPGSEKDTICLLISGYINLMNFDNILVNRNDE